jgi:RNA polymerase sigma-70 factor (ECF subfamily)
MSLFRDRPDLLDAFRRGERNAFEEVYWTYVDRIEQLVRHGFVLARSGTHVNGSHRHEVGDLVHEIFAKAFSERARLAYDGLREYAPYLATIAKNLIIDWSRQRGREMPLGALGDGLEVAAPPQDEEPAWGEAATVAVVQSYLAELGPELRDVHHQRFVLGRSQYRAATELRISRQQVRTREKRLRQGLAQRLKTMGIKF